MSDLKAEFKLAAQHYFLAGNLPATKRCLYFIMLHQNDFPADLDAEILKACAGEFEEPGRRMLRQALAVYFLSRTHIQAVNTITKPMTLF